MKPIPIILSGLIVLSFMSCTNSETAWDGRLKDMASLDLEVNCRLNELRQSTIELWDRFNDSLEISFPVSTSEYVREKMLEVRNGQLLRMFQTYDSLGSNLDHLLYKTEATDKRIVQILDSLTAVADSIDREKMTLFAEIEDRDPASIKKYQKYYAEFLNADCD